jgi:hypothetical protein
MGKSSRILPLALACFVAGGAARDTRASEVGAAARAFLDLSPDRVAAFNQALRDFTGAEWTTAAYGLSFEASYQTPVAGRSKLESDLGVGEVTVPTGRDVTFEEAFLVGDREVDYERAARRWVSDQFRGGDGGGGGFGRWHALGDWQGGPVVGFRRGIVSASVGEDGYWRVRISHAMANHPGWAWRAWAGEKDGEQVAGFTIGRSLYASRRTR